MRVTGTEPNIVHLLQQYEHLPRFRDGRIDYTNSKSAPILLCFIEYDGEFLLLKRSEKVLTYRGLWSTVAGFIDEPKPLAKKVLEELDEELGIQHPLVQSLYFAKPYEFNDVQAGRSWTRCVSLATLKNRPDIVIDGEHEAYTWKRPSQFNGYSFPPGFEESLGMVL